MILFSYFAKNGYLCAHIAFDYPNMDKDIIKPDGFVIPADAARVHGITSQRAMAEGVPLFDDAHNAMR